MRFLGCDRRFPIDAGPKQQLVHEGDRLFRLPVHHFQALAQLGVGESPVDIAQIKCVPGNVAQRPLEVMGDCASKGV